MAKLQSPVEFKRLQKTLRLVGPQSCHTSQLLLRALNAVDRKKFHSHIT